jgi:hypothetical protein
VSKTQSFIQGLLNAVSLDDLATDPSSVGLARAIGSFYLRSGTGQAWLKTGAGNTDWQQLQQSYAWYSVMDYGARGDNVTDDTVSVQAAMTACNAAGGGVVYFPRGIYRVSQLSMAGFANVQLLGSGPGSVIRWTWNAATVAGSMITLSAGAIHCRFEDLCFNGAGLTNPAVSRLNHLVAVGTGAGGAVTESAFIRCLFTGMVALSGDGVHVLGAAGNLVTRLWVDDCNFDGCSRFGVGAEQGFEYLWVINNYFTANETDIGVVATANSSITAITIACNNINHTGSVRHAIRCEGDATGVITEFSCVDNVILGGFATFANILYGSIQNNIFTSGAFASADAAVRIFAAITYLIVRGNVVDRATGASAGTCITVEKSTGAASAFSVTDNVLINEITTAGFVALIDCVRFICSGNVCRGTNAGASTVDAIDVQAVTVALTDALVGPSNQITAAAGTYRSAVRLLSNGANVTDCSINDNLADQIVNGCRFELIGGAAFNGQLMMAGNNWDATTGDFEDVGVTVFPRIGFNAGTFGPNLFTGVGTPEGAVTARVSSMYLRADGGQASSVYYKDNGTGNTGWLGIGGSAIVFGTADAGTVATALFFAPGYELTSSAVELSIPVNRPGTVRNLYVNVVGAGTGAATVTYTVRKNGADQTLLTTLGNTATGAASDLVNSFTVVAGDLISIQITKSGVVAAGQTNVFATVEIV